MDTGDINKFKRVFKELVYEKGLIVEANNKIKQLSIWDKNGSHTQAINNAIYKRDKLKQDFEIKMNGKDYEHWKSFSKKLTNLVAKEKRSLNMLEKTGLQLSELEWTF